MRLNINWNIFSGKSRINRYRLGVVFNPKEMVFALTEHDPINGDGIIDFQKIQFPENSNSSDLELASHIKYALKKFLKNRKNVEIWTSIQSNKIETKIFEIPVVKKSLLSNAAIWGIKKHSTMDPLETIYDYRVIGKVEDAGVEKYNIQAYAAPKSEVRRIQEIFKSAGFPLAGISVATFGVQNILKSRVKDARKKNLCVFFVGRGWSRIDIYVNGVLMISRDVKTGFNSFLDAIREKIKDGYLKKMWEL